MSKSILILLSILLCGCTLTDQIAKNPAFATPQPSATEEVQATATIEVATPTPYLSPSPNFADTQIAGESANNAQQMLVVQKRQIAVDTELAMVSDAKTQTTKRETHEVSMANAAGTQLVISSTEEQASRNFQLVVPTLIVAGTKAMYTGQTEQAEITKNYLIGAAMIIISIAMLIAMTTSRKVAPPPAETAIEHHAHPALAKEVELKPQPFAPVSDDGMGLYLSPPGNHAHFYFFLDTIFKGEKGFSKTDWEGADSPYNRKTYGVVYNWLWANKLIELPAGGRIQFTVAGQKWANNWMDANLIHSPAEDVPISQEIPAENSQPPENQPPESDGGVVLHEEKETTS